MTKISFEDWWMDNYKRPFDDTLPYDCGVKRGWDSAIAEQVEETVSDTERAEMWKSRCHAAESALAEFVRDKCPLLVAAQPPDFHCTPDCVKTYFSYGNITDLLIGP